MRPWAGGGVGRKNLQTVAVDVREEIKLARVKTNARRPDALPVGLFAILKIEIRSEFEPVESVAEKLPVHQILGVKDHETGHRVHCGAREIEIVADADQV